MHTPSTRILSALAYERGEEFDPEMALTPDLLETLSLIEQARPTVGDDGPYERTDRSPITYCSPWSRIIPDSSWYS